MVTPGFLPRCTCGGGFALYDDAPAALYRVTHTDPAGNATEREVTYQASYSTGNAALADLLVATMCPGPARHLADAGPVPCPDCGGRSFVVDYPVDQEARVIHETSGTSVERRFAYAQLARLRVASVADLAGDLCPARPGSFATGGIVTPGTIPYISTPSPEMITFPDGTVRYNRQALEGHALNYSPGLVWSECPCGGLVHRERDAPAALDNFVHLDTRAEIRHGQITDLQMARARMTPDQVRCPLAFLAAEGPLGPPDGPAAPQARFACAVEYPDGERAVSVVAAADRQAVEAALASLAAAGVRFTLTPEGAP